MHTTSFYETLRLAWVGFLPAKTTFCQLWDLKQFKMKKKQNYGKEASSLSQ